MGGVIVWFNEQGCPLEINKTGVNPDHVDFGGRVQSGRNFVSSGGFLFGGGSVDPNDWVDCNGHGTHVASTAAGAIYGVAKQATVHAVRVLNCSGSGANSGVIAGVDWVAANAVAPAVANMSLGGSNSTALDNAVDSAIDAGITFVVAAGNDNLNACNGSPNRVPAAITVSATTNADAKASYSNYGSCLDIWAPGSNITAASYSNNTGTRVLSGTSMASPHVAGAAALVLGRGTNPTPAQLRDILVGEATANVLTGNLGSGSPNRLMYVSSEGGSSPVDNAPTAAFSFTCNDLDCSFNAGASSDDKGIAAYSWSFGDGSNGNGSVLSHSAAGSYNVTLTVTDTVSQTDSESKTVSVVAPDESGGSPCSDCSQVSGSLSNRATTYSPLSSGFGSNGGQFQAFLRGPANADFDLYLERYSPGFLLFAGSWSVVAQSAGNGASEDVVYNGNSGTYRWRLRSQSGSGAYTFYFKNP